MIIRRRHTANFTTIGNALFDDERLAADELGILAFLRSKPHDWEVRRPAIMRRFRIGRDALKRIVDNWLRTGWARAEKMRLPNGTFDIVYEIRDEPGPSLSEHEIRQALSLVSSEAISEIAGEEGPDDAPDDSAGNRHPPPGQPGVVEPVVARAGMVDNKGLNTDSPRKDSNQNLERGPVGYDRKAAFIAAFEARWPTAASDDRSETARACRELPGDEEPAALNGIGAFLEKLKRDGRKHVPAGAKYLRQKPWTLIDRPQAQPTSQALAEGGDDAKAVALVYALAGKGAAIRGFMRLRDGSISYRREVTAQLRALAQSPPQADWPTVDRRQAAAWNELIDAFVTIDTRGHLKEGDHAPWLWPPSKDGRIYPGADPPEALCTEADLDEFAKTG